MAKIIAVAENFAFGPVGKLLTITKPLLNQGHEITFIGEGTAYQLGSKEKFSRIIKYNTDDPTYFDFASDIFKEADVLLSCMDRSSVLLAQKVGLPVIWLDTLFWWWDSIPDYLLNVDCYIKQNTLKDKRNFDVYANKIKQLYDVGPIVDLSVLKTREKKKQIIIAFGGMEAEGWYKVGVDTQYPYVITDIFANYINVDSFDRVIFTGNHRVLRDLSEKYNSKKFQFLTLSHEQFVQELANSEVAVMVPGLETPLEAFSYGVPIIFLPPSNSSQYVQLDDYISKNAALMHMHFRDYYPELNLLGRDLRIIMKEFLVQAKTFEEDREVLKDIGRRVNDYLLNKELQNRQIQAQYEYIKSLGGNGTDMTINLINIFLNNL